MTRGAVGFPSCAAHNQTRRDWGRIAVEREFAFTTEIRKLDVIYEMEIIIESFMVDW